MEVHFRIGIRGPVRVEPTSSPLLSQHRRPTLFAGNELIPNEWFNYPSRMNYRRHVYLENRVYEPVGLAAVDVSSFSASRGKIGTLVN